MKKLVLFCIAACFCVLASAQKVYFLYLQSDDQAPFYVKMGDKILSSATAGYLIIPQLTDGNYTFSVGFAKSTTAEAKFNISINQNDKGYLIKHFDDGLALFDVKDLALVKAAAAPADNTVYQTKSDPFSTVLAKAANDPGLLKVPIAQKEQPVVPEKEVIAVKSSDEKPQSRPVAETTAALPQPETEKTEPSPPEAVTIDSSVAPPSAKVETPVDSLVVKDPQKMALVQTIEVEQKVPEEAVETAVYKPTVISRYAESSTTEGFGLVYLDKKETGIDTIRILIPAPRIRLVNSADNNTTGNVAATVEKSDTALVKTDSTPVAEKAGPETITNKETASAIPRFVACKSTASDKDFLKLRRKMAAQENNDDMLVEARKEFRNKCYSVEQLRHLSALFLTSASKYRFFDLAYEFVSDRTNFPLLGSELTDEHYTRRFKALIGE